MPKLRNLSAAILIMSLGTGVALLATCEDAPRTTTIRRVEDPWSFAQGAGLLPVIVRGRPSFAPDPSIADAVLQSAEGAVTWTATPPLIGQAAGDVGAQFRLVFIFNGGGDPCGDAVGGDPQPQGAIALLAAFCNGTQALVRVDGRLARSEGIDDRRFHRLVAQATRELLAPPPAPRP